MLGVFGFGKGKSTRKNNGNKENNSSDPNAEESITLKEFWKAKGIGIEAAAALPYKFDHCSAELGPPPSKSSHLPQLPEHGSLKGRPLAFVTLALLLVMILIPKRPALTLKLQGQFVKCFYGDSWDCSFNWWRFWRLRTEESQSTSTETTKPSHSIEEIWARRNFMCDCPLPPATAKLLKAVRKPTPPTPIITLMNTISGEILRVTGLDGPLRSDNVSMWSLWGLVPWRLRR